MAGRSRVNREVHARFCEGLGVKFPRATRRAPRGCTGDEGGPLGVGLQEQASKHLKLLWSKAMVVSVEEKVSPDGISCESERRAQANYPMRCRKHKDDVKTGGYLYTRISPEDTCLLSGRRPA
jgi:hypothetical protein